MNQKKTKSIRHCIAAITLLISSVACAQEDSSLQVLDDVIITAQRQPYDQWLVPYGTQVLTSAQIKRYQPRTTPEALTGMSGVFVQKTNHGGGSPFIRGLTGNQILLLVDGIRLNNSTYRYGPNQYLNSIDIFHIHKVEVAKGTGSAQYGTDALGGVVHILTEDPAFIDGSSKWSGKVQGKLMSGGMEKTARGQLTYHKENIAIQLGGTVRDFGDLIGGDTTGRQAPSGYKEMALDAKIKWRPGPKTVLIFANQFFQQKHVPVYHKVKLENYSINEFEPQQRLLQYARLKISGKNKWFSEFEFTTSFQQSLEGRSSEKKDVPVLRRERDKIKTVGLIAEVTSRISNNWTANSGIEGYMDKVNSSREDINKTNQTTSRSRGLYPDNSRYGNYSVYSLHRINLNNWSVEGGVRFNVFSIRMTDSTLGALRMRPSALVYNAALMYHVSRQHHVFLSYSTGYRAPNIDDMGTLGIVDFRYELPSYSLLPERSANIELGYKVKHKRWSAALSGYYMHLDDLITRNKLDGEIIDGYAVYRKENSEKGYIKGLEVEGNYELVPGWKIKANLSYTFGHNISRNEPMRRIPPLNGRLSGIYQNKKWFGSVELLYASGQRRLAQGDKEDNRIPIGGTPGYRVLNLYSGYEFPSVNVSCGLQNIFNHDYRTHGSGINGVGRSIWFSVGVTI